MFSVSDWIFKVPFKEDWTLRQEHLVKVGSVNVLLTVTVSNKAILATLATNLSKSVNDFKANEIIT